MSNIIDIETNIGTFQLELYDKHAPKTCFNFTELVKIGEYVVFCEFFVVTNLIQDITMMLYSIE